MRLHWLDYTARHRETSRVFLDMAHLQPELCLQMGKSFNISFNFMFFSWSETIRVDPSRSELIQPGLAVQVDPVWLLCLPIKYFKWVKVSIFHLILCFFSWSETIRDDPSRSELIRVDPTRTGGPSWSSPTFVPIEYSEIQHANILFTFKT